MLLTSSDAWLLVSVMVFFKPEVRLYVHMKDDLLREKRLHSLGLFRTLPFRLRVHSDCLYYDLYGCYFQ